MPQPVPAAFYSTMSIAAQTFLPVGAEQVVWSDFRHDGEPDRDDESKHFDEEDAITDVGPLVFDRAQYEAVLDETAKRLGRSFVSFWHTTDNLNQSTLGLERVVTLRQLRKRPPDPKQGLQWTIDGRPLARTLRESSGKLSKRGRELQADLDYSVVQRGNGEHADEGRKTIRLLLGEGTWDELPGRIPLLVGDCLDIPCGVITAHIERMDSIVARLRVNSEKTNDPRDSQYHLERRRRTAMSDQASTTNATTNPHGFSVSMKNQIAAARLPNVRPGPTGAHLRQAGGRQSILVR